MDSYYFNRHLPTITLYLWPTDILEYWWSHEGKILKVIYEPIEDEL